MRNDFGDLDYIIPSFQKMSRGDLIAMYQMQKSNSGQFALLLVLRQKADRRESKIP